jgi:hypothetical protein
MERIALRKHRSDPTERRVGSLSEEHALEKRLRAKTYLVLRLVSHWDDAMYIVGQWGVFPTKHHADRKSE